MGVRVVGALVGASFGETGVGRGTRVRGTLDGAGFGEGLWGPRSVGNAGVIVGNGRPLDIGGWPASAALPGNGGVVGTGDGAGDGVVRANDDSGPSAGVGFARAVDDAGPLGRGIFDGRAGSAFEANPGGRLGLPKGRMADRAIASTVAACPICLQRCCGVRMCVRLDVHAHGCRQSQLDILALYVFTSLGRRPTERPEQRQETEKTSTRRLTASVCIKRPRQAPASHRHLIRLLHSIVVDRHR